MVVMFKYRCPDEVRHSNQRPEGGSLQVSSVKLFGAGCGSPFWTGVASQHRIDLLDSVLLTHEIEGRGAS